MVWQVGDNGTSIGKRTNGMETRESCGFLPVSLKGTYLLHGPRRLGILGCAIGGIIVRFKDYATDHRTTTKCVVRKWVGGATCFYTRQTLPGHFRRANSSSDIGQDWYLNVVGGECSYLTEYISSSHCSHRKQRRDNVTLHDFNSCRRLDGEMEKGAAERGLPPTWLRYPAVTC